MPLLNNTPRETNRDHFWPLQGAPPNQVNQSRLIGYSVLHGRSSLAASMILCLLVLSPKAIKAQQYYVQDECYRNTEKYIPGYATPDGRYQNGYVSSRREAVPCGGNSGSYQGGQYVSQGVPRCDRNATLFGGLLGGAIAANNSKSKTYSWSIPLGVALGVSASRIGCR